MPCCIICCLPAFKAVLKHFRRVSYSACRWCSTNATIIKFLWWTWAACANTWQLCGYWTEIFVSGTDKPECVHHMLLDDYTRRVSYEHTYDRCDSDLGEGWYRFYDRRYMNTQCANINECNTDNPGWLTGGHPSVSQGRVTRKVCFGYKSYSCCRYSTYITVRNCGLFYVYKLKPTPSCDLRYCSN